MMPTTTRVITLVLMEPATQCQAIQHDSACGRWECKAFPLHKSRDLELLLTETLVQSEVAQLILTAGFYSGDLLIGQVKLAKRRIGLGL